MPMFMDVHNDLGDATPEDVAADHARALHGDCGWYGVHRSGDGIRTAVTAPSTSSSREIVADARSGSEVGDDREPGPQSTAGTTIG